VSADAGRTSGALVIQLDRLRRGPYGEIADAQNAAIWSKLDAARGPVLEIGCGLARLVATDPHPERLSVGVDVELTELSQAGRAWHRKRTRLVCGSGFSLPFVNRAFQAVIFRESLHHLKRGDDPGEALREATRVCGSTLIVFDPNVNLRHRIARRLIGFEDEELTVAALMEALRDTDFEPVSVDYRDVLAFPLSGGLISRQLWSRESLLWRTLVHLDTALLRLLDVVPPLKRFLCWRYLVVARRRQ
jgi:SAM-dependent methyltransferase